MQGRLPHVGPRSATTLTWVLQQLPSFPKWYDPYYFWTQFLSLPMFSAKFQGGNGSSPVRGLPSTRRSPQNSHSAPGSIVSVSQTVECFTQVLLMGYLHMRWMWVSVCYYKIKKKKYHLVCRSGRIAPLLQVCVLGNTILKLPPASVSR